MNGARESGNEAGSPAQVEPTLGYVAPMGTEVRGAEADYFGRVTATWPNYVFVESQPGADRGFWIPVDAFVGAEGPVLLLDVTREEAARRGWGARPAAGPEALPD